MVAVQQHEAHRITFEACDRRPGRYTFPPGFPFCPGTATVYTRAAPNITSFRVEPCTSLPPVGARARPSADLWPIFSPPLTADLAALRSLRSGGRREAIMQATHSPSFEAAFSRNSDPSSQEHQGLDSRGVLPFDELRKDLRRAIASAKVIYQHLSREGDLTPVFLDT